MESSRLPRFKRASAVPAIKLTERDREIIRLVERFRFVRSSHICSLIPGSPQQLLRRLQLLYHHGFLERPRAQLDYYHRGGSRQMVSSDDIGHVSWVVPTVTLMYPSNIPGGPGHNWADAIAMATPIAHKGVVAGAKVQAMTMLDILLHPELVKNAWDYFNNVQTKDTKYTSFIRENDVPAIWLNKAIMEKYRPEMKKFY